jgi:hypothetical protein
LLLLCSLTFNNRNLDMLTEEELDELEDIRLYDEVKLLNEPSIPIEDAFKILDEKRRISSAGQLKNSAHS